MGYKKKFLMDKFKKFFENIHRHIKGPRPHNIGDSLINENDQINVYQNIELNINIKVPTGNQIPKVINSFENNNPIKKLDYINNSSLTNIY